MSAREAASARLIRATFNAAAPHFADAELPFWTICGRRTVELLCLASGNRVVDYCCGAGDSAVPAALAVGPTGSVLGLDLAESLLTLARARSGELRLPNVTFRAADVLHAALPRDSADAALCVFALYYLPRPAEFLSGVARTVRRGGRIGVTIWGDRSLEPAHSVLMDCIRAERPDLAPPERGDREPGANRHRLVATFGDAGLGPPTITEECVVHDSGPDRFWRIVLGSGYRVSIDAMDAAAAERVRENVRARLLRRSFTTLTSDVIYATATVGEQGLP